jgi:hypothetical protein
VAEEAAVVLLVKPAHISSKLLIHPRI